MFVHLYKIIHKSLFWRQVKSTDLVIDSKLVERYFDETQSIIFSDIYAEKEEAILLPVIESYSANSVLDLGCGNGRYAKSLCPQVKEYVGVDISNNFIAKLKKDNITRDYNFIHSAAHEFKTQRKFDVILMIGLLTYMNDDDISEMILNSSNHLNKDGVIIVRNVNHLSSKRSFFNDKWNVLKYFVKKPTYQIIRRPESEFMEFFSEFKLISKFDVTDTAGIVYTFKRNE